MLRLTPQQFWRCTPAELRDMADAQEWVMRRASGRRHVGSLGAAGKQRQLDHLFETINSRKPT